MIIQLNSIDDSNIVQLIEKIELRISFSKLMFDEDIIKR